MQSARWIQKTSGAKQQKATHMKCRPTERLVFVVRCFLKCAWLHGVDIPPLRML